MSAPLFLASSTFPGSHKTATLNFFPVPEGSCVTVLKLKSPPLDCLSPIRKETSIDSSNFAVEFFLTNSKISFKSLDLKSFDFFKISLNLFDFFFH